jgi:hypothetical protein
VARNWYRNQAVSRTQTSSTAYGDAVSLTIASPAASTTHYLLWSTQTDNTLDTVDTLVRLRDDTAAANLSAFNAEPNRTTDVVSFGGVARWISGASPTAQTFSVEYATEGGSVVGVQGTSLVALVADPSDQYAESLSQSTTTSTSLQTKLTLSFTPASVGDYLIIASAANNNSLGDAQPAQVQLDINGTAYFHNNGAQISDNASYMPWMAAAKVTLAATSQTIAIKFAIVSSGTAAIRDARILAMRLDTFDGAVTGQNNTRLTTTSGSPQTAASATVSALPSDYLTITAAMLDHSANTSAARARTDLDGAVRSPSTRTPGTATREMPYFAVDCGVLSAGSRTAAVQYFRDSAGTTGITDAFAGLLLPVAPTAPDLPAGGLSLSGPLPLLVVGKALAVPARPLGLSPAVPRVLADIVLRPPVAATSLIARTPAVSLSLAVMVPAAGLTLGGGVPGVAPDVMLAAPAPALSLAGASPSLPVDRDIVMAGGALAVTGAPPLVAADWLVRLPVGAFAVTPHALARAGPRWRPLPGAAAAWTAREPTAGPWSPAVSVSTTWTPAASEEA